MNTKTLNWIAKTIRETVPYHDGKTACANLICELAQQKLGDKWTKKREKNFRHNSGI
jgi:hypothetical protein